MLGSALYSLSDLVSAFLLIVSFRVAGRSPDASHPYGHGKIEYLVTLLISLIVMIGTVGLIIVSTFSLYSLDMARLHWIGIWASVACISLSHIVYRMVLCAGKQANSSAMIAHSKHIALDSLSNVAVIVAIIAAEVGFTKVDPIIAIIESVHILYECSRMMHRSINQLMDTSIDAGVLERIHTIVSGNPRVRRLTDIKGKHSGRGVSVDIEILLDGSRRINECNAIVKDLKRSIRNEMDGLDGVYIHYHPYTGSEEVGLSA